MIRLLYVGSALVGLYFGAKLGGLMFRIMLEIHDE